MRRRLAVMLLGGLAAGCQDSVKLSRPDGGLDQITIAYLCGNRFELRNPDSADKLVHYAVLGTAETGNVVLPGGTSTVPSITRLTAVSRGPLQISTSEGSTEPVENAATACPSPAPQQPQSESGEWSPPFPWPVVAVHLHLLPTGRVLSWGRIGAPQLYNPAEGSFIEVPSATMVFCGGHTFLADGRLLVSGGHLDDRRGLRDANLFDPGSQSWLPVSAHELRAMVPHHDGSGRWRGDQSGGYRPVCRASGNPRDSVRRTLASTGRCNARASVLSAHFRCSQRPAVLRGRAAAVSVSGSDW